MAGLTLAIGSQDGTSLGRDSGGLRVQHYVVSVVRSSRVDGKGGSLPHTHITSNVYNGHGYRLLDLLSSSTGEALRFLKLCVNRRSYKV